MHLSKTSLLLAGVLVATGAQAQIDKVLGGAVAQASLSSRYAIVSGNTANVNVVSDPAGGAKPVLRINAASTDTLVGGLVNNYVAPLGETTPVGLRWYGMSVYFPSDWSTSNANPVSVATISTATASGLPPPVAIVARGANLELSLTDNYLPTGAATASNSSTEVMPLGPLVTGRWYCFVLRAEWGQQMGVGKLQVFMNTEKVYDAAQSLNNYGTAFGNVPRVGLMFPGAMGVSGRTLYADFVRLGGSTTYIEQMYAETPCATQAAAAFAAARAAAAIK